MESKCTGKGGVPAAGFGALQPKFCLSLTHADVDSLPVAHTCNHELSLPHYETEKLLQQKLKLAIQSNSCFELA